jgi:predicted nucleic acid-binding protein
MAGPFTIDASVFINAFNPYEEGHEDSHRLLGAIQGRAIPMIVPTLVLPEVAATIARGRNDGVLGYQFADALGRLPYLYLVDLDKATASKASEIAAAHRLRGADAVYAAVAWRFGAELVTRDRQQRDRVAAVLTVHSPAQALAQTLGEETEYPATPTS